MTTQPTQRIRSDMQRRPPWHHKMDAIPDLRVVQLRCGWGVNQNEVVTGAQMIQRLPDLVDDIGQGVDDATPYRNYVAACHRAWPDSA